MKKLLFLPLLISAFNSIGQLPTTYQTNSNAVYFRDNGSSGDYKPGGWVKLDGGLVQGNDSLRIIGIGGVGNTLGISPTGALIRTIGSGGSQNLQQTLENGDSANSTIEVVNNNFILRNGISDVVGFPIQFPFVGAEAKYKGLNGYSGFYDLSMFGQDSAFAICGFLNLSGPAIGVGVSLNEDLVRLYSRDQIVLANGISTISVDNQISIGSLNDISLSSGTLDSVGSYSAKLNLEVDDVAKGVGFGLVKNKQWEAGSSAIDNSDDRPFSNIYYGTLDSANVITDVTRVQADFEKVEMIAGADSLNPVYLRMYRDGRIILKGVLNESDLLATTLMRNPSTNRLEWGIGPNGISKTIASGEENGFTNPKLVNSTFTEIFVGSERLPSSMYSVNTTSGTITFSPILSIGDDVSILILYNP